MFIPLTRLDLVSLDLATLSHKGRGRNSLPVHIMPRKHLAHGFDQIAFLRSELRLGLLLQIVVAIAGVSGISAPMIRSLICTSPLAFSSPP